MEAFYTMENLAIKVNYCYANHCNFTESFRGAPHSICNLTYSIPRKIPVILNNGSNYDFHLMIKHLGNEFEDKKRLMLEWKYQKIRFFNNTSFSVVLNKKQN